MSNRWVVLNGKLVLEKEAMISVTDRGFLFGEGIFTSIRLQEGQLEFFKAHLHRLHTHAQALGFTLEEFKREWTDELIHVNQAHKGTWKLKIIITTREEKAVLTPGNVLMLLNPYETPTSPSTQLCLFPHPIERPLGHIKSLSYLDHLYIKRYAQQKGCEDAVTTTKEGYILETGCSNLFWIDQETCWIPDINLPYLKGVFLQSLLPHLPFAIQFCQTPFQAIPSTAQLYTCNALQHLRQVSSIEDRHFAICAKQFSQLNRIIKRILQSNLNDNLRDLYI